MGQGKQSESDDDSRGTVPRLKGNREQFWVEYLKACTMEAQSESEMKCRNRASFSIFDPLKRTKEKMDVQRKWTGQSP